MSAGRWVVLVMMVGLGCGGDDGGASAGQTTMAETTASNETTASGGSTSATSADSGSGSVDATADTGGGTSCASAGDCPDGQYCDWGSDSCGVAGDTGTCREPMDGCADDARPVCACDDQLYPNICAASSAGQDTAFLGDCPDPMGGFRCGYSFCISGQEYCLEVGGLMPTFECIELPPVCQPPDCSCITNCCGCDNASCCGQYCTNVDGDLTYQCPGQ